MPKINLEDEDLKKLFEAIEKRNKWGRVAWDLGDERRNEKEIGSFVRYVVGRFS